MRISLPTTQLPRFFLLSVLTSISVFLGCGGGSSSSSSAGQLGGACALRVFNGSTCSEGLGPVVRLIAKDSALEPIALCSGVAVTPSAVLTAAHCLALPEGAKWYLQSGSSDIPFSEAIEHPGFRAFEEQDTINRLDIGILKLEEPLVGLSVLPILVSEQLEIGQELQVYGFGVDESQMNTFIQGTSPLSPKSTRVEVVFDFGVTLFAGREGAGVCSGDSGGPGVTKNSAGVAGVVTLSSRGLPGDCQDSIVTFRELTELLASREGEEALTAEEKEKVEEFLELIGDAKFPVNIFTDISSPEVLEFILQHLPDIGLV